MPSTLFFGLTLARPVQGVVSTMCKGRGRTFWNDGKDRSWDHCAQLYFRCFAQSQAPVVVSLAHFLDARRHRAASRRIEGVG